MCQSRVYGLDLRVNTVGRRFEWEKISEVDGGAVQGEDLMETIRRRREKI